MCMCVCVHAFLLHIEDLFWYNTDLVGNISPHGDLSLLLMTQNIILEVLVRVRGEVRLRLELGMDLLWLG